MINIKATICGTIIRPAVITINEKHVSNLEFGMSVKLPSRSEDDKPVTINVAIPDGKPEDIKDYVVGNRIIMDGTLVIKKDGGNFVFSLIDATPQITYSVPSDDKLRGTIEFRGRVKEYMEKIDRRGMPYLVIQAYSSSMDEKGKWEHLWFRFKRFPKKGEVMEDILPAWLTNGCDVEIKGDLQITSFNNYVIMGGRIHDLNEITSSVEIQDTQE